jgi:universal stress protein E
MSIINKIFVVIDPTSDQQTALDHAVRMTARNQALGLHVYCVVHSSATTSDSEALERVEVSRHRAWVDSLVAPVREQGCEVQVEIEWTSAWRDALAPAAKRCGADLIIKAASAHRVAGRRLLKTADWTLLRQAHCPVYLAKGGVIDKGASFLLALDLRKEDDLHSTLNERVIEFGQVLVQDIPDASLHAVNAYVSSERYVYPIDLAAKVGIPSQQAHTIEGAPSKVIAEVANDIKADMVIIGNASRQGAKAAMIGNTAEKVLDAVDANVLVVTAL